MENLVIPKGQDIYIQKCERLPVWSRKFDYDEELVIHKYSEDEELEQILMDNTSAI